MRLIFKSLRQIAVLAALSVLLLAEPSLGQISFSGAAPADERPALPDPLTPETANALISRLSDSEVRALLLEQLHTRAAEAEAGSTDTPSQFFHHATTGALASITTSMQRLPQLFSGQARAFANFFDAIGGGFGLLKLLGFMVLVFGTAALAEAAFRRATRGWQILPPADPDNLTLRETLQLLGQRLTTQVIAVVIFVFVARTVGQMILPDNLLNFVKLVGIYLIGFPRLMLAWSYFVFAPMNPEYRLLNVDTRAARAFCFHSFFGALLIGFTGGILIFNEAYGVPRGETRLGFWLNAMLHIYLVAVIWKYRADMVTMMRGYDPNVSAMEDRIARFYPYFAIIVVVAIWWIINIVVSFGNFALLVSVPQYKTMTLLLFAPIMDTAIRGIVRHMTPAMTGEGAVAERAHEATKKSYVRIGRVVVFGLVLITIADFWGMDPSDIATAGVGERLAAHTLEFLIILSVGYILYEAVSLFINRKLAAEYTASGFNPEEQEIGGDGGGAGGSRLSTVLPLVLLVCRSAIIVMFLLLALGHVGIDTTPLLAGAGIVGLAIGFGAQKLVSDVVSGVFFLVDDAFRTGEYVEVDGTMGTVEKISIRSMQLRHHKGPVHTIPYGEIPKITNYSRDWVIMKLRFTVPFDSDPNQIKKIFKKIGQELLEVPEFKDDFLAPFKSQGVLEIDDVGMVIRGKFMCKPGTQFMIRKEIYNRVSKAFAEAGIDFARREVRVALPAMEQGGALTEEDKAAIAAAATQAAQEQTESTPGKDDR